MPPSAEAIMSRSRTRREPLQNPEKPGGFVHTPALDGLRSVAILLVLFNHLFWANAHTGNRVADAISIARGASFVGVNLFFALSGFLITGILLDTLTIPHFFKTFYARRTLRIFPLYYGALFLLLALTRPLHFIWNGWQYFYLTYTANLILWQRPPLILHHVNINHFWSLQVEEQFYLVWPLIVFRVRKLRSLIQLSLIACAAVLLIRVGLVAARPILHNPYVTFSPTFSCCDNLLFGCCLAALMRTSRPAQVLRLAPRAFAACVVLIFVTTIPNGGLENGTSLLVPTIGYSLIGIASAALVAMTLRPGSTSQRIFQNATLRFFGKYSYGMYVFHYTVSATFNAPLRAFFNEKTHNKGLSVVVAALICFVLTLIVALLSYHLYESHFLKLKKYFSYNQKARTIPSNNLA
jgi:peptidoglycan/LPS O-acetylase OafA/YrhL